MPVRLGAVSYLNARPLVEGLDRDPVRWSVRFDVPARCAERLEAGEIDLGLIPSIEFARHPDYAAVPGVAIASADEVASVALFSRVPIGRIRTIAVDDSSRTSAALLRTLCARRFGIEPELVTVPPDPTAMLRMCDAALLIGDPALFFRPQAGVSKIDLGAEWKSLTDLPFVWAFWAGRPDAVTGSVIEGLRAARDAGVRSIDTIAGAYCAADEGRADLARRYLRRNIHFDLGEAEQAGLLRFYAEASALGLAPRVATIELAGAPARPR